MRLADQISPLDRARIIEPDNVPEFFVTHLADINVRCGLIRFALACERHLSIGTAYAPFTRTESIVRVRLCMPIDRENAMNGEVRRFLAEHRAMISEPH